MERFSITPEAKFSSTEQEVSFLRQRLKQLEQNVDAGTHELVHMKILFLKRMIQENFLVGKSQKIQIYNEK